VQVSANDDLDQQAALRLELFQIQTAIISLVDLQAWISFK